MDEISREFLLRASAIEGDIGAQAGNFLRERWDADLRKEEEKERREEEKRRQQAGGRGFNERLGIVSPEQAKERTVPTRQTMGGPLLAAREGLQDTGLGRTAANIGTTLPVVGVRAQLERMLERGEISEETFAEELREALELGGVSPDMSRAQTARQVGADVATTGLTALSGGTTGLARRGAMRAGTALQSGRLARGIQTAGTRGSQARRRAIGSQVGFETGLGASLGASTTAANPEATTQDIALNTALGGTIGASLPLAAAGVGRLAGARRNVRAEARQSAEAVSDISEDLQSYINRNSQSSTSKNSAIGRLKEKAKEGKTQLVDDLSPLLDPIRKAVRKGALSAEKGRQVDVDVARTRRTSQIVERKLLSDDSPYRRGVEGLEANELDEFQEFLKARHGLDLASTKGVDSNEAYKALTGSQRSLETDAQLVTQLAPKYAQRGRAITEYSQNLLEESVESGVISRDLADTLKEVYPNYVPFDRVMDSLDKIQGTGKGISFNRQKVVRALEGSQRSINPPLETLIDRTAQITSDITRNRAARTSANALEELGIARRISDAEASKLGATRTISYREGGDLVRFEVPPDVAKAAKNMEPQTFGLVGRIMAVPARGLRTGTTGAANPAFGLLSFIREQAGSAIISERALSTHNPVNIARSIYEYARKGDLYKEAVDSGAINSFYDLVREKRQATVSRVAARGSAGSRVKQVIKSPKEMWRVMEDLSSALEEIPRFQQYRGMRQSALNRGASLEDAINQGTIASQRNNIDFLSYGEAAKAANAVIPYLNTGIQGGRQLARAFRDRPMATSFKSLGLLVTPMSAVTAYNLKDPERRRIYRDIQEYEKENNFVLILPSEEGYKPVKIPLPPGIGRLAGIGRATTEALYEFDENNFQDIASSILGAFSPVGTTPREAVSTLTPTALKVPAEIAANTNLFTGQDIVPDYIRDQSPDDPTQQRYDDTSPTLQAIANVLGVSPLQVQHGLRGVTGEAGLYGLTGSDRLAGALFDVDTPEGRTPVEGLTRRFSSVAQGQGKDEVGNAIDRFQAQRSLASERANELVNTDVNEAAKIIQRHNKSIDEEVKRLKEEFGDRAGTKAQIEYLQSLKMSTSPQALSRRRQ